MKSLAAVRVAAVVMVAAFYAPLSAQTFSDWSAPVNLGPTLNTASNDN